MQSNNSDFILCIFNQDDPVQTNIELVAPGDFVVCGCTHCIPLLYIYLVVYFHMKFFSYETSNDK